MQGTCLRRASLYGRTACNKHETRARRLLPVACLPPSRADPQDVSLVCGIQQAKFEPTPTPPALDFGSEEGSLHRPNLCNSFTVASHPFLLLLCLSTNGLCFDMLDEAIWPSPVPSTGIGSWSLSSHWNRGSNKPLSWCSHRDVIGLFCISQSSRPLATSRVRG